LLIKCIVCLSLTESYLFCNCDAIKEKNKNKKVHFSNQYIVVDYYTMVADPALVFPTPKTTAYVLYRQRFYVLGVFSFLAFNQCAFWLTFSPVSPSTRIYYGISSGTVDLLLNWGPIIFIPCLPFSYLLLNRRNGLRHTVILLAIACLVATLLRVIPAIITSPSSPHFKTISLSFIHAGQIINAACGPLVMVPVSQLSCLWFGPSERTRATTLAVMANVFGGTVSFLVNPAIVSRPENVPYLLYFHLALAIVAAILALVHFPAEPPTAPSAAAELLMQEGKQSSGAGLIAFKDGLKQCMTNLSFVLLSTAGGVMGGTFAVWTGLFATILDPEYSEQQAGKSNALILVSLMNLSFLIRLVRVRIIVGGHCWWSVFGRPS
jgi:FLVCR family MFS transporter 7